MTHPSTAFSLEEASLRDLFSVRRLEKECFNEDAWSLLELAGVLSFPAGCRIKASVDQVLVGFIAGDREINQKIGWITTLGVLPAFHRRGIAAALLQTCEKGLGLPIIRLCVRVNNIPAIALYQRAGYKQMNIRRQYYNNGEDAFVFEKRMTV